MESSISTDDNRQDLTGNNVNRVPFSEFKSKIQTEDFLKHESGGYCPVSKPNVPASEVSPENGSPEVNVAPRETDKVGDSIENMEEVCTRSTPAENILDSGGESDGSLATPEPSQVFIASESNEVKEETKAHLDDESNKTVPNSSNEESAEVPQEEEWMDILGSGHIMKKIVTHGIPDTRPHKSDICEISYTGRLEDGTVVEQAEHLKINLNDNEVIQGIDFALALMETGEEAEMKISSRFAFGSLGRQPNIPSGATLHYTVTLHDVQEEPPMSAVPVMDRIAIGSKKKERGNWWYSREEPSVAINCYRRALDYLDDTDIPEPHNEDEVRRLIEERLKTYNNLAASQMKIQAYDAALMSVNNVLNSQPQNVKALFRKSKILREKGEIQEAISVVRQALSIDKDSQALQQELSSLLAAQRHDNTKQRELYKKMLGGNSTTGKVDGKKSSKKSSFSTLKWTSVLAVAAVVVAGTVAFKYKL